MAPPVKGAASCCTTQPMPSSDTTTRSLPRSPTVLVTRRSAAVVDAGCTRIGVSPRPDEPVATASTSEPSAPRPACTISGASRTCCGTPAKGAGKAAARGRICAPPRATRSTQPKVSRQFCVKPEPALRSSRSSEKDR